MRGKKEAFLPSRSCTRIVGFASKIVIIIENMNLNLELIESTNLDIKSTVLKYLKLTF
jgi:hypothetical protein